MIRCKTLIALFLSLCLMLGAVSEVFARSEMALMPGLVLCGGAGLTITLGSDGQPVQPHPCTQCLAAGDLALPVPAAAEKPPADLLSVPLDRTFAASWLTARALTPLARGPPCLSV